MSRKLCHSAEIKNAYPVRLHQDGIDRFTVTYGQQVKTSLTYGQAAKEYGACIMHALACEGLLDNRERGQRA